MILSAEHITHISRPDRVTCQHLKTEDTFSWRVELIGILVAISMLTEAVDYMDRSGQYVGHVSRWAGEISMLHYFNSLIESEQLRTVR